MLVFRASKLFASESSTQVDETILRPSQKIFWPVKELDGICRAARGFAMEAPPGLKRQELLTHAGRGCGPGTWVGGSIRKLCRGGGYPAPKTDKATERCLRQEKETTQQEVMLSREHWQLSCSARGSGHVKWALSEE